MKLEDQIKVDNHYYVVCDAEAAEYIADQLYRWGSHEMNLLAARNSGKVIIEPEDVPEVIKVNQVMELMVNANKLKEMIKKDSSEEESDKGN